MKIVSVISDKKTYSIYFHQRLPIRTRYMYVNYNNHAKFEENCMLCRLGKHCTCFHGYIPLHLYLYHFAELCPKS